MKKITALLLAFMIIFPFNSNAAVTKSDNVQIHFFEYRAGLDRYVLDYTLTGYADAVLTIFITPSNVTYTKEWGAWSVNRSIYHNCNGTFNYHFTVNEKIVGYIYGLETTLIQNEVCEQEMPGNNQTDLNTRITDNNENGKKRINYDENGSNSYKLQKSIDDGSNWTDLYTNGSSGTGSNFFEVSNTGYYRIIGIDENENITSKDAIGENEFNNNQCDGCKTLFQMLSCPAWEDYMNEFSEMISGAIPAPPSINDGMDYLIEKLAEQDVEPTPPEEPTPYDPDYEEQTIDLPSKIETVVNPPTNEFQPETGGTGSGPVIVTDPGEWTPNNDDLGYTPPDPDADEAPDYEPPGGTGDTPPTYTAPGGTGDTPPTYTAPGGTGDTPPTYTAPGGTGDTPPTYTAPGGNGSNVPNYNYQ